MTEKELSFTNDYYIEEIFRFFVFKKSNLIVGENVYCVSLTDQFKDALCHGQEVGFWDKDNNFIPDPSTFVVDANAEFSYHGLFAECDYLQLSHISDWDLSKVIDMSKMFYRCMLLVDLQPLNGWDVSNTLDMGNLFSECSSLEYGNLYDWKTGSVQNMEGIFNECCLLSSVDFMKDWDTSHLRNLAHAFYRCESLLGLHSLKDWNVSNLLDLRFTFAQCDELRSLTPLANWKINKNVNVEGITYGCGLEKAIPDNWYYVLSRTTAPKPTRLYRCTRSSVIEALE